MRMAWKLRVAGWILPSPRPSTEAIRSASWPVRCRGSSSRRATMVRAILRLSFSSPYCHSTSAISRSSARASQLAALSPDSGSMRMSSGPSLPKLKPRSATSSCGDDTPRSKSTPSRPAAASSHSAMPAKEPRRAATRPSAPKSACAVAIASGSLSITNSRPSGPSRSSTPRAWPPRPNVPSRYLPSLRTCRPSMTCAHITGRWLGCVPGRIPAMPVTASGRACPR